MGNYFRTLEMVRLAPFRCLECQGPLRETRLGLAELRLECPPCAVSLVVLCPAPIPDAPDPALERQQRDKIPPLHHGDGLRCLNCGREQLERRPAPPYDFRLKCPRCNTTLSLRARTPAPGSASAGNGCRAATPASAGRSR